MKETRQSAFAGALRLPRVPVWRLGLLWEDCPTFRTCKEMFLGDSALRGFSPKGKLIVTSEHLPDLFCSGSFQALPHLEKSSCSIRARVSMCKAKDEYQ